MTLLSSDFESDASTNSATRPFFKNSILQQYGEHLSSFFNFFSQDANGRKLNKPNLGGPHQKK